MIKLDTTFVVGAGASVDYRFPLGEQLTRQIAEALNFSSGSSSSQAKELIRNAIIVGCQRPEVRRDYRQLFTQAHALQGALSTASSRSIILRMIVLMRGPVKPAAIFRSITSIIPRAEATLPLPAPIEAHREQSDGLSSVERTGQQWPPNQIRSWRQKERFRSQLPDPSPKLDRRSDWQDHPTMPLTQLLEIISARFQLCSYRLNLYVI